MAWRYSASSYTPRDTSASRYGSSISSLSSKFESPVTERQSRWSKSSGADSARPARGVAAAESTPIWAKATISENPSSIVQRLKDKYNTTDSATKSPSDRFSDLRSKRTETKDMSTSLPSRTYGRTTTGFNAPDKETESKKETPKDYTERRLTNLRTDESDTGSVYSRLRKRQEKSPEPEKSSGGYEYRTRRPDYTQLQPAANNYSGPLENKSKIYISSSLGSSPSTTRYLTPKKYPTSPTTSTPTYTSNYSLTLATDRHSRPEHIEKPPESTQVGSDPDTVVMVTRETSPTEPSSSVYLRTRRADLSKGIEKRVTRPKVKPETSEKETQTEKQDEVTNKSTYSDTNVRAKPWSSYVGGSTYSSTPSRYSGRSSTYSSTPSYTSYGMSRYDEYKRSISREEQNLSSPKTETLPEIPKPPAPVETLATKPPAATRPTDTIKFATPKSKAVSPLKDVLRQSVSSTKSSSSIDTVSSGNAATTTTSSDANTKSTSPLQFKMSPSPEMSKSPSEMHNKFHERVTTPKDEQTTQQRSHVDTLVKSLSPVILQNSVPTDAASPLASKMNSPSPVALTATLESPAPAQVNSPTPGELKMNSMSRSPSSVKSTTKSPSPAKSSTHSATKSPSPAKSSVQTTNKSPTPARSSVKATTKSPSPTKSSVQVKSLTKSPVQVKSPTPDDSCSVSQSNGKSIDDSSTSESSSDEVSTDSESDDEPQNQRGSAASTAKRSLTNFLQSIPNIFPRKPGSSTDSMANRSRTGLYQKLSHGSTQKINFKRVESGEKAWWMESTDKVPEGILKAASSRSMGRDSDHEVSVKRSLAIPKQYSPEEWWLGDEDKSMSHSRSSMSGLPPKAPHSALLAPPYLINRQFSSDKDWLKSSSEDVSRELPVDNTTSIMMQCSGDNTWWLDGNDNVTEREEIIHASLKLPQFPVIKQYSEEKGWRVIDDQTLPPTTVTDNLKCDLFNHNSPVDVIIRPPAEPINHLDEEGEEEFDVTPALRRRREQQGGANSQDHYRPDDQSYSMKFTPDPEQTKENNETNKYLEDFKMECSVKDLTQKLVNGLSSPLEEKVINLVEQEGMCGMISKAKAELLRSQNKADMRRSPSEEIAPSIADLAVSEVEVYWKELVESINRPLRLCDLDFTDLNSDDEKDLLGNSKVNGSVPPPPPLLSLVPTPPLRIPSAAPAPPPMSPVVKNKKTVKLFWKEVKDDPMMMMRTPGGLPLIWDELPRVGVDTHKLEHLFESKAKDLITKKQQDQNKSKEVIVLDPKRSNAINIGMTKLPPPRAIKAAILKMDGTVVNKEGIEKLLAMLPTEEEILRIQDAQNNNPELPLGSAEQFLLTLASITEIEARLKLWAFKLDFENSEREICEPIMDLKQGIDILRVNRTFRGILSTLLSIGNFLNGYDVKGFQIDYLSKVPEVKDTVHKHSLLHHLCIIVMEKFPDSTDLYSEIGCVSRAAKVDFDELAGNIKKVEEECKLSWTHLKIIAKHEGHTAMKVKMSDFLADCAERIIVLGTVHKRVMSRFHKFIFWLGIPMNRISTTRPNEVFKTVSEFALEYRTTRERVLQQMKKMNHRDKSKTRSYNDTSVKKMNSKEAKDDAKLRQLLGNESTTSENNQMWRRQRKPPQQLDTNHNDDEIIETLIKTANQVPSSRVSLKERRRSRIMDRKLCK